MPVRSTGKLRAALRRGRAARNRGVRRVQVGFFATARYPDGTPVTNVAAWNEYGTTRSGTDDQHIPPRPFMQEGAAAAEDDARALLATVNPQTLEVTPQIANRLGAVVAGHIQDSIVELREPPNAPSTIETKGSSNPLVDTGHMSRSVSWETQ